MKIIFFFFTFYFRIHMLYKFISKEEQIHQYSFSVRSYYYQGYHHGYHG